jgi:hypothetical protein
MTRFSSLELRELELAETLVPFGEYAAALRARYMAYAIRAALTGSRDEADAARQIAEFISYR